MSEPRGKFSKSRKAVPLLFPARGLADAVGHHADEALGQLGHFLHEVVKLRFGKSQDAVSMTERAPNVNVFILEKGNLPVTWPALTLMIIVSPPNSPRAWSWPSRRTNIASAGSPGVIRVSP